MVGCTWEGLWYRNMLSYIYLTLTHQTIQV